MKLIPSLVIGSLCLVLAPVVSFAQDQGEDVVCAAMICCGDCLDQIPADSPCRVYYEASCEKPQLTPPPTECELRLKKIWALMDEVLQDPVCTDLYTPPLWEDGNVDDGIYGSLPEKITLIAKGKRNKLRKRCKALFGKKLKK